MRIPDVLALISPKDVEKIPSIQRLETEFKGMIPPRFGNIRTYVSPTAELDSAIRADCQMPGCGTRIIVHIGRDPDTQTLLFIDSPRYSRLQNAGCGECLSLRRSFNGAK